MSSATPDAVVSIQGLSKVFGKGAATALRDIGLEVEKRVTISAATQHSQTDYNLFEGTEVTGTPEVVLLRGQILVEGDQLVAEPGVGQFVARAKFGEELKPAPTVVA